MDYNYKNGEELQIKQIRSAIGRPKDQLATLKSMGLGRIGKESKLKLNLSLFGKLRKVWHLVEVK